MNAFLDDLKLQLKRSFWGNVDMVCKLLMFLKFKMNEMPKDQFYAILAGRDFVLLST